MICDINEIFSLFSDYSTCAINESNVYYSYPTYERSKYNIVTIRHCRKFYFVIIKMKTHIYTQTGYTYVSIFYNVCVCVCIYMHIFFFKGVATIFILCECRSSDMYKAIWKKIVKLVPTLEKNVKFLMSDYEIATMKVMSEQFPTAEVHGCWFHFNQVW